MMGFPWFSDWVNPISGNDFLIKYSLLLVDDLIFGYEGGGEERQSSLAKQILMYFQQDIKIIVVQMWFFRLLRILKGHLQMHPQVIEKFRTMSN